MIEIVPSRFDRYAQAEYTITDARRIQRDAIVLARAKIPQFDERWAVATAGEDIVLLGGDLHSDGTWRLIGMNDAGRRVEITLLRGEI